MRIIFFIIVLLLSLFWIFLSFYFFDLDNIWDISSKGIYSLFFESIFFVWLFVFWFFLWRFFPFFESNKVKNSKAVDKVINENKIKKTSVKVQDYLEDDNLKIIEWIGPKVEDLLKQNWIKNMGDLSKSSYDEIKSILDNAGDNYKIINPRNWSYQAELAVKKEWWRLKEYQEFLKIWV